MLVLQQQRASFITKQQEIAVQEQELQFEESNVALTTQLSQLQHDAQRIRDFLQMIQRKSLKEASQRLHTLHEQAAGLTQQIMVLETAAKQLDALVHEKDITVIELRAAEKEYETLDLLYTQKYREMEVVQQQLRSFEDQKLNELAEYLHTVVQSLYEVQQLIQTHKSNQLRLKQLQQDETYIKELYTIFSKELLFVVLQDFLPQLEQTINSYLAQVVDYEIRFQMPTEDGDTIELDIEIHDANGARPVKSLS